jgi:hypothetical protein
MVAEASFDVGTIKRNPGSVSFVGRRNSNFARSVVCCQFHFYLSPFFWYQSWFRSGDINKAYVCVGMTVVEVACHHLVQMRLV